MNISKNRIPTITVAICSLLLITGTNAQAATIAFTDNGPHYWEVVESVEETFEGGVVGTAPDGAPILGLVHSGWRITYDIFNNSTYTINGFMVGVSDSVGGGYSGSSATAPMGWSSFLANRWSPPNNNYLDHNVFEDYNYAYKADVMQGMDFGDDAFPSGEPIHPFQAITGEFSFASDSDELASPIVLFATDAMGQDIVLFGESSYQLGTGQNFVSGSSAVPIPGAALLLASGLLGFAGFRRKTD